jgi:predicted ester cyclase
MDTTDRIEANALAVRRLYEIINENRGDLFATVVAPSYIDHSNGAAGPAGFADAAANLHRAYDDLHFEIAGIVGQRDMVAVRWVEAGVHVGPFFNLRPTGKPFESRGLTMYRLHEGCIVESWLAIDPSTIRAQQAAQEALEAETQER